MVKKVSNWLRTPEKRFQKWIVLVGVGLLILIIWPLFSDIFNFIFNYNDPRNQAFVQWATGGSNERQALVTTKREACPGAPFILPTDGFIGLLYGDPRGPYSRNNPHQGIDIFSEGEPGTMPVYAAYEGYISRDPTWRSALIQRIPNDPLNSGSQIWLYYTHMADQDGNTFIVESIPPGTQELFVEQGTLLGYTGDYNGTATRQIWVHLHFSIVKDDGNGRYLNELDFNNTVDPSPYFGMTLNYANTPGPVVCLQTDK